MSARLVPGLLHVALNGGVRNRSGYYAGLNPTDSHPKIYFDVTHLVNAQIKTGIQRVVLSLYQATKKEFGDSYQVCQVYLCYSGENDAWLYHHYDPALETVSLQAIVPGPQDVFLGVDLNALIIKPVKSGLFKDWQRRGVTIAFFVHDILPIEHPEWWPKGAAKNHELWLNAVLDVATHVICVSETTLQSVRKFLADCEQSRHDIVFKAIRLGSDLATESTFKDGLPLEPKCLEIIKGAKTFAMVGTLEPRKAHQDVLAAFDLLWSKDSDSVLVFVGKHGWMREGLVKRLQNHPMQGTKLFWLQDLTDEALAQVYDASDFVVQASFAEGFGLPAIEALRAGKIVIARDIPIFREVLGSNAYYFPADAGPGELADVFRRVIKSPLAFDKVPLHEDATQTWSKTARQVAGHVGLSQSQLSKLGQGQS